MKNSENFLRTFNKIERWLRKATNAKKTDSFYFLVERAKKTSPAVRQYEIDLKEFADLRNAIVHERTNGHLIAEPHEETVNQLEKIATRLTAPPLVFPMFKRQVTTCKNSDNLASALSVMFQKNFSQLPVIDESKSIIDILTTNTITRWLAQKIEDDIFSLEETKIIEVVNFQEYKENYQIISRKTTLFEIIELSGYLEISS